MKNYEKAIIDRIEEVGQILKNQDEYLRIDHKNKLNSMLNQYVSIYIDVHTDSQYNVKK